MRSAFCFHLSSSVSSNPIAVAFCFRGRLAQLVRAPALQAGGRRFESCTAHQAPSRIKCFRMAKPLSYRLGNFKFSQKGELKDIFSDRTEMTDAIQAAIKERRN